ncbi:kinase-like domain-containing protein [Vararia minispora EC-137]|uniref:Kinase-like domain-containing protein n=1 Tax=Vararia minispora EC-137 TaxID=1314806 RepID=A0ACB8Q547_9AGAM|nr:kinase-like domain-containing protein [Vararia minispora EC-137]
MSYDKHDLTTVDGLLAYLQSTPPFAAKSATSLAGGNTNYVYRIHLQMPYEGGATLVVKHSKPYLGRSMQESTFAGSRQVFEVGALHRVRRFLPADAPMTVPVVHHFDEAAHVIIMDDAGEDAATLKQLILDHALDVPMLEAIGRATGHFLAQLHTLGTQDEEARRWASGNTLAREISAWATYGRLVSTIDGSSTIPALCDPPLQINPGALGVLGEVARIRADQIMSLNETFTMGDFWPGNFLVRSRLNPDGTRHLARIFVVDWEVCKASHAGFDVGQFCGDLRVLLQAHPELRSSVEPLVSAFVQEYTMQRPGPDVTWASVAAVHFGVHMVTWGPLIPYDTATRESTRALVEEGVQIIQEGYKDQNWTPSRFAGLLVRGM